MTNTQQAEHAYWCGMLDKAAANIAKAVPGDTPVTECDVKKRVAYAFRHKSWDEVSEVVVEAAEWIVAHLMKGVPHAEPAHVEPRIIRT